MEDIKKRVKSRWETYKENLLIDKIIEDFF